MASKKISITDLRLGMFVSELDISWVKSPFFRHKRLIEKQDDIELLKQAGVLNLVIDMSKSKLNMQPLAGSPTQTEPAHETTSDESNLKEPLPLEPASKEASLKDELKVARKIQSEVLSAVGRIQSAFERGQGVSPEEVNPIVEKTLQSIDSNSQAIMALMHEVRDGSKLATHSFGVFALVLMLSNHLNYSLEDQQLLGLAALTHDAGWSKLPTHLMSKGKPYTPTERKLVAQHIPIVKTMLLKQPDLDPRVILAIEQHHESLDGTGYPQQQSGDAIHPFAQVLAVCNEYDEMVHGLGENPGTTPQVALSCLFKLSKQNKLDPVMTTQLISLLGVYPLGSAVELLDKRRAVVVELNQLQPLLPKVIVFYSSAGKSVSPGITVDLAQSESKINRVLDIVGKDCDLDPENRLVFNAAMLD